MKCIHAPEKELGFNLTQQATTNCNVAARDNARGKCGAWQWWW
jgi:hypothetical protein